uniref:Uncharacterized protein AlNc14C175G8107 n=1 Tax=Albugo laibachii Nc14 TaxID=890382 RepID=F0WNU7_9STRA|nr:conserved hypothetical protein [Albugo laibachii Nc14]|eukprot:CCA22990.1 conserved hypothetical protein [Albugo laibachii Nc14]
MNEQINVLFAFDNYVFAGTESGRVYRWKVGDDNKQLSDSEGDVQGVTHYAQKSVVDVAQWHIQPCFIAISALNGTRNNRIIYPQSRKPIPCLNLAIGTVSGDFFLYRGDILLQHIRIGSFVREICIHRNEFIIGDELGFMYAVTSTGLSWKKPIANHTPRKEVEKSIKPVRAEPSTAALQSFRMLDVERTESAYVAASMGMSELVLTHQGRICSTIPCSFPIISMCCLTEENSASDVLLTATEKGIIYQLESKTVSSDSESKDFQLQLTPFTEVDFLAKKIASVDLIHELHKRKMYWICLGIGGNVAFMCERDVIYQWPSVTPHQSAERVRSLAQVSYQQKNAVDIFVALRNTIIRTKIDIDTVLKARARDLLASSEPQEDDDKVLRVGSQKAAR